jgi:hypothetical protein
MTRPLDKRVPCPVEPTNGAGFRQGELLAGIAQLAERRSRKAEAVCSIQTVSTNSLVKHYGNAPAL